jgi:ADP-ribose pyrophosphatase
MSEPQDEPTLSTQLAFEGKLLTVRVDTVSLPGGRTSIREIVEHVPCVCMAPIDAGDVLLVRQYRKAVEAALLEVPAGGMEPGESPEDAVLRELQEETGHTAGTLKHLQSFYISPGYCTEEMHAFLATDLRPAVLDPDYDEDIQVVRVPVSEIPTLLQSGQVRDAKSITTLLLASEALRGS